MRLVAFLSESEESTKAKRIIEVVAALYPELQVE